MTMNETSTNAIDSSSRWSETTRTDETIRIEHLSRLLGLERWLLELEQTCAAESLRWLIERDRRKALNGTSMYMTNQGIALSGIFPEQPPVPQTGCC